MSKLLSVVSVEAGAEDLGRFMVFEKDIFSVGSWVVPEGSSR
jgi:hypothetical protein